MIIAYQGIAGSYTFIAAHNYFGEDNQFIGTDQFKDIFELIKTNKADYGVVPVENSLAGSVYENYDLLTQYDLQVIAEYYLKIEHCLLGVKNSLGDKSASWRTKIKQLKTIYSHPKALEQCLKFFEKNSWLNKNIFSDTAGAAKYIADKNDPTIGAIAGTDAAKLYNLDIIEKNIEDNPSNYTRFLVISKKSKDVKNADKCSLIFALPHVPGSLYKTLKNFADSNLNLTKIESRPIHGKPFEYIFHIDLEFAKEDIGKVKNSLSDLKTKVHELKILGFYPHGDIR